MPPDRGEGSPNSPPVHSAPCPTPSIRDSILDTIGDTPLVRLSRIGAGLTPQLVAKLELFNPGGSIKDRDRGRLIEAAERDGSLRAGGTIIEPTSGNTGTGLAIAARLKGYRVIAVMPDKMSREKIDLLRAFGAEVVIAPTDVDPESPQSYYRVADRLTEEIPGAFQPNQYRNPANPQTHYETTGPEIWRQTGGRITHLVAGVGTGGTITGVGRYLQGAEPRRRDHRRRPRSARSTPATRCTRTWSRASARTSGRPPTTRASSTATSASPIATASSPPAGSPRPRGCSLGGSCGLAVHAALEVAEGIDDPDALVVVILPDGGRAYLSKIFNDTWMASHGMLERTSDRSVGDVLRAKQAAGEIPPLVVVETRQQVKDAIALLHEHRVSPAPGRLPHRSGHDGRLDRRARPAARTRPTTPGSWAPRSST